MGDDDLFFCPLLENAFALATSAEDGRRIPPAFEALVVVIEDEPMPREALRLRAERELGAAIDDRTFRRHLLKALETGCAVETEGGYATPVDNLDSRWPHNAACKPVFRITIPAFGGRPARRLVSFEFITETGVIWIESFDAYRVGMASLPARTKDRRDRPATRLETLV